MEAAWGGGVILSAQGLHRPERSPQQPLASNCLFGSSKALPGASISQHTLFPLLWPVALRFNLHRFFQISAQIPFSQRSFLDTPSRTPWFWLSWPQEPQLRKSFMRLWLGFTSASPYLTVSWAELCSHLTPNHMMRNFWTWPYLEIALKRWQWGKEVLELSSHPVGLVSYEKRRDLPAGPVAKTMSLPTGGAQIGSMAGEVDHSRCN